MGGRGGNFILEGGNDCGGQKRERQREEEEMKTRMEEGDKQRRTEKRKT